MQAPGRSQPRDQYPPQSYALYGAIAVIILYVIWKALPVLLLAFGGILVGVLLHGLSRRIAKRTVLPYGAVLAGILLIGATLAGLGAWYFGNEIGRQFQLLWGELGAAVESLRERLHTVPWVSNLLQQAPSAETLLSPDGVLLSTLNWLMQASTWAVAGLLILLFVGIYTAADRRAYEGGFVKLFPFRHRERVRDLLSTLGATLWYWLLGRLTSMAIITVLSYLALWWLDIPLPGPLAIIAGLLTFIPNIGPTIALIPPVLLALQQGAATALWVTAAYLVIQFLESYLVTPLIEQRAVSLPPGLIIVMQIVFYMLAGALGLALATPLTAVGMVLLRRLWLERQLGDTENTREDVRAEASGAPEDTDE